MLSEMRDRAILRKARAVVADSDRPLHSCSFGRKDRCFKRKMVLYACGEHIADPVMLMSMGSAF